MDLIDLRLFLHVVEQGSITAGADRSHMTLASASARVRALEDALGTPLLVRERRGAQPTPAGQTLARHAQQVLAQVGQLHEASMRKIDSQNASFWAAINHRAGPEALGMLERQRVKTWLKATYETLDRLPV